MRRLVQIEMLKLRTTRLTYGLFATSTGLTALFSLLAAARAGTNAVHASAVAPLSSVSGLGTVTTTTGFALLLAAVLGVTVTSGEFRHGTATLTYLAFPQRDRVSVAKALAAAIVGAIFGCAAGAVATIVGLLFATAQGDPITLGAGTLIGHIAGAALGAALLAALGAGLGSLIRAQLGAVIGLFAWVVVGESMIGALFTSLRPYLPYAAATTLGGTKLGDALGVLRVAPGHGGPLPFAAAAALVLGAAVALFAAAKRLTVPRDIS
jgi:ABC-2 type transport system permease protein